MRVVVVIVIALTLSACVSRPDSTVIKSDDTWDRQVTCAERADRFAESMRPQTTSPTTQMGNWQTHYNTQTKRCYALIDVYNLGGPGVSRDVPYYRLILWDAFERRPIARYTQEPTGDTTPGIWCSQTTEDDKRETSGPPCKDVAAYVAKLMRE